MYTLLKGSSIMTKLFCKTCGNTYDQDKKKTYDQDKKKTITKCPRCGSIAYTAYAAAIHRHFKCEECKKAFRLSEVACRYFARYGERPQCPKCKSELTSICPQSKYLKDSGQAKKITPGANKSLDRFGLKTW